MRQRAIAKRLRDIGQKIKGKIAGGAGKFRRSQRDGRAAWPPLAEPVGRCAVDGTLHQPPWVCAASQKSSSVLASMEPARVRSGTNAARSMASYVVQGRALATSPPSWWAKPSSTSGMARVSCSGRTAGGARLATACERARLGHAVEPGLERRVVGQDQVGLGAGLVNEAAEADDVGNFGEGFADCAAPGGAEKTGLAS